MKRKILAATITALMAIGWVGKLISKKIHSHFF